MVLVEAGPKLSAGTPTAPDVVNVVEAGVVPIAFTNPIFVDVDGNGFALSQGAPVQAAAAPGRMTGVTRAAREAAVRRGEHAQRVEYVGLYWHFVDVVWIFLFPLLYLAS